jgi:hypothetical protein
MARLPSQRYLVQQPGSRVVLFEDGTERRLAAFDPADAGAVEQALKDIYDSSELGDEDKAFALFWCGYFCAYAGYPVPESGPVTFDEASGLAGVFADGNNHETIACFDPRDGNAAAMVQGAIHLSTLARDEKRAAHFWSGYFYGAASAEGA